MVVPTDTALITNDTSTSVVDSLELEGESESAVDTIDYDYATYFLVVADTSKDYFLLRKKMMNIHSKMNWPIDTMGRYFNKKKNEIVLPDDDEDELYAGSYFPRRFPTSDLSLEYLDFYQEKAGERTMALVAGIYETEQSADSALTIVRVFDKKAYKLKSEIFIGCMH
ncbi:MAG: hypothetical protein RL204_2269 [Bacteroidota bacterium]